LPVAFAAPVECRATADHATSRRALEGSDALSQPTRSRTIRTVRARAVLLAAGATVLLAACGDDASKEQNALDPDGKVAQRQLDLFLPFFWIAVAIGVGVIGTTILAAIRYRHRPGNENPKQVHGNTTLEIGWTIVPAVIMAAMAVPTVATLWDLDKKPADDPLEVTVYGKQWWWEYQYTNLDIVDPAIDYEVNTANELHVPAGRPVYFTLRSTNVAHSFWVPSLAGKKDVIPSRDNHVWFEADPDDAGKVFYGQCVEYCGLSHADMRLKVFVDSPGDFAAWARRQREPWDAQRLARAEELGITTDWGCTSCHYIGGLDETADAAIADGTGANTRPGPNLTHLGERTTFAGAIYDLDVEQLTEWIWHAPDRKPNQCDEPLFDTDCRVGMPSFEKTGMTREQAEEIARFLLEQEQ
jgi:cytochrome c oxidase subunit 2